MTFRSAMLTACVAGMLASLPAISATAAVGPHISVTPKVLTIARPVAIRAAHLPANRRIALLVAVPKATKGASEAYIGLTTSDKNGSLTFRGRMPVLLHCGKGTVYAYPFPLQGKLVMATTRVSVTGCKASGKVVAPPPPPTGGKKKP